MDRPHRSSSLSLLLACALLIAAAPAAWPQPRGTASPQTPGLSAPQQVSMTVSGGVSLGSYQAGATWAFLFVLKNHDALAAARDSADTSVRSSIAPPSRYALDVLTGASAGNINAVLAALEHCTSAPFVDPVVSLFWRAWIPVGVPELIAGPVAGDELGAFSRATFESLWRELALRLESPNREPACNLLLGITATKLTPHNLRVANGIDVPVQRFAGVFRLVSDTVGLTFTLPRREDVLLPELTDILILDPAMRAGGRSPRRTRRGDVALDIRQVRELAEASSSFPIAFAPRSVSYQLLDTLGWRNADVPTAPCVWASAKAEQCAPARSERFVDGGLFDNRPLGLALGLSRAIELAARQEQTTIARKTLEAATEASRQACASGRTEFSSPAPYTDSIAALVRRLSALDETIRRDSLAWRQPPDSAPADSLLRLRDSVRTDSLIRLRGTRTAVAARLEAVFEDLKTASQKLEVTTLAQRACATAIDRARHVEDSLRVEATRSMPPRLLYFIDEEARRTDLPERSGRMRERRAGVAAALRALSNAFETSQNGELRLFASRIAEGQSLGVNSRYPRLMAEHLAHFGAFLAPTFREHDFYAGIYDGLRSAFRELHCRESTGVATRRGPAGRTECEATWLRLVIADNLMTLTPEGRVVLDKLFAYENGGSQPTLERADQKTVALATLIDANVEAWGPQAPECKTKGLFVETPLCSERLLSVIAVWKMLLRDRREGTDVLCDGPKRDREACRLVRDAQAVYHGTILEVLARLRHAEVQLDRAREPGFAGMVGIPLFLERAYNEQYRSCWQVRNNHCVDLNPTTADKLKGRWYVYGSRALPVSIGGMRNGTVRWAEWRPTAYLARVQGTSLAVIAPVEMVLRHGKAAGAVGGGLTVMPSFIPFFTSVSASRIGEPNRGPANDVTIALFSGIARFGLRDHADDSVDFLSGSNITFGIGDTNGLSSRALALIGSLVVKILPGR